MDRRDFLKNAIVFTALGSVAHLAAQAGIVPDDKSSVGKGPQVTRRRYKNTDLTLPMLGFGMMRLPRIEPDKPNINYAVAEKMIARAMAAGANYFDTAYMYHDGLSEKCVGDLLSKYPRESYMLVDKMPVWMVKNEADLERIFQEQLSRCKTNYFDFYMLHALNSQNWGLVKQFHAYEFLARKKAEGKIRKLGFSFHDTPEVLKTIAPAQPWDFAMIQLNYLDWEIYRSREQYEILTNQGIPVIVMEPLRGGALATLNPAATEVLKKSNPAASNASWALRYAASLPNVLCVISGMSLPEHVEDNIATFTPFKPLSEGERETLVAALNAYRKSLAVPCTLCRYCMPCPVGVDIPRIFGHYNQYKINGNKWLFMNGYNSIPEDARAAACVSCGKCLKHCPQHINIPEELHKIDAEVKRLS